MKDDKTKAFELDLDALVDKGVRVKFSGSPEGFIEVFPPDVEDFFTLQSIQAKLQGADPQSFTTEQTEEIMLALRSTLSGSVPYIKENGLRLKMAQLLALMGYVMGLATPAEDKAMAALGIEKTGGDQGQKKPESASASS